MNNSTQKITSLHYILAFVILSTYGARVCPFLDSLTFIQLVFPIAVAFTAGFFIRINIQNKIDNLTVEKQIKAQFFVEQKIFIAMGFGLAVFNTLYYHFPVGSGLKVLFGTIILGIFIGLEQALILEKSTMKELIAKGANLCLSPSFISMPAKFIYMSILMIGSITGILLMAIAKDLDWFHEEGIHLDFMAAKISILGEILFIILIVLIYSIRIIQMFGSNLKILLNNQNKVLNQVSHGNLETHVPVVTNDEFGLMAEGTNSMIIDLKKQKDEIQKTRDVIILGMATLAEARDNETGAHIIRTQKYVRALALELKKQNKYTDFLTPQNIEILYKSAPLHDVGKVGIPDDILLRPGKLSRDEFKIMKKHAQIGAQAIKNTKGELIDDTFLTIAQEIANYHHEKYDGSGYPEGLIAQEIPLSARLMAVADVYDALISKRVYKEAFSHEKAKKIILDGYGLHFDPIIVDAFISIEEEFIKIKNDFQ